MPISQSNQLFSLIKSLTKSEKRNFRLYVNRISDSNSSNYIQLFDLMDKQKTLNEELILKKLKGVNKTQLSNLKRHLYTQIMRSLEQMHRPHRVDIQIRELLNFAQILYGKGLYLQSLKILQKAKTKAERSHYDLHYLSILEFEKKIEGRHITRTGADKSLDLIALSEKRNQAMSNAISLSNLRLTMYNLYVKNGHVNSAEEAQHIQQLFLKQSPKIALKGMSVKEKSYLFQAFVWYYYILQDFVECYNYAKNWIELMKSEPHMIARDPDIFMRGYHYLLMSAYHNRDLESYKTHLTEIEKFRKDTYKKFNPSSQMMSFIYVHNGRLNRYFLDGNFAEGVQEIPKTLRRLQRYGKKLDPHRVMVFYYKIAWMYLGNGDADKCVDYLQKVIQMDVKKLREDIQGYARLLLLMAHYDLENEEIMPYLVKTVSQFFGKMNERDDLQNACLKFFQRIVKVGLSDRKKHFIAFQKELAILQANPYKRRAFMYLDIPSWVEGKISRRRFAEVVSWKTS